MNQIESVAIKVNRRGKPIEDAAWYQIVRLVAGKRFARRWVRSMEVEVRLPKGDP